MGDERAVVRLPPVAAEEARHHAVAAAAVPDEKAARLENARKFLDHARIVRRLVEEAERREEIEHAVEATGPSRWQLSHVTARIPQSRPRAARPGEFQQVARVVQSIDVESRFGEEVRVATLPARHVEDARAGGQLQDLEQTRDLSSVTLEREERFVLQQVLGVEVRRPPVGLRGGQKKTGSRYAP